MRKIFLAFGLVGLGAMSASFAACSSSSGDDSGVTGTDSGSDTSVATDTGTGTDTGTTTDSGACAVCSQTLQSGLAAGSPCATSIPVLSALLDCVCNPNPLTGASSASGGLCDEPADAGDAGDGGPSAACSDLCTNAATGAVPTADCRTCASDNCSAEVAACAADGVDGG